MTAAEAPLPARRWRDERGLFVLGLLLKSILVFAILGVVTYEIGQVLTTRLVAGDVAQLSAQAGADTYFETRDYGQARKAAVETAQQVDPDVLVTLFEVAKDGTVSVEVEKTANTLVVARVSFLKHLGVQHALVTGTHRR